MIMVRLIYASRLSEKCDVDEIRNILEVSQKKNQEKGITGILCYNPLYFMQWIEGPREAVNQLYNSVLRDDRHTDAQILEYREISAREFESWNMAYVSVNEMDRKILLKYTPDGAFQPYLMNSERTVRFLLDLARTSPLNPDNSDET